MGVESADRALLILSTISRQSSTVEVQEITAITMRPHPLGQNVLWMIIDVIYIKLLRNALVAAAAATYIQRNSAADQSEL